MLVVLCTRMLGGSSNALPAYRGGMTTHRRANQQAESLPQGGVSDAQPVRRIPVAGDAEQAARSLTAETVRKPHSPATPVVAEIAHSGTEVNEGRGDTANASIRDTGRHRSDIDSERHDRSPDGVRDSRTGANGHSAEPAALEPTTQGTNSTADDGDATGEDSNRSGLDARRRGWFWHWNNVVTQYSPLIGLKGVGLLNSYTVWTDRRDESPHRGYAFPSQQSEADFYGEERAELITINKILVALDLIEIRKEMLTRVDERGRRWRVPHNLYRVKDRPDGVDLRALDVIRVAELAKKDPAVFRYVRRVFSDRFKPIDGDNVWQKILDDLRDDATWRELQNRTRAIEAKASARTRAGHKSRSGSGNSGTPSSITFADPTPDDQRASDPATNSSSDPSALRDTQQTGAIRLQPATTVAETNTGLRRPEATVVDQPNQGSAVAVANTNTASADWEPTSAAESNTARLSVVGTGNTTYDQEILTTTTTTTSVLEQPLANAPIASGEACINQEVASGSSPDAVTAIDQHGLEYSALSDRRIHRSSDGDVPSTADEVESSAQVQGWRVAPAATQRNRVRDRDGIDERAASGRATAMVSGGAAADQQLGERDGHDRRTSGARVGGDNGERYLAGSVGGGPLVDPCPLVLSTFEAANDRRASGLERSLLAELERDADSAARAVGSTGADWVVAAMREAVASGSAFVAPKRIREILTRWARDPRHAPSSAPPDVSPLGQPVPATADSTDSVHAPTDVRLPGGASGNTTWSAVLADLARLLDRNAFDRLLAGSHIARYWRGTVEVQTTSPASADKLSNEYRAIVERHLNSRLSRPVAVRFEVTPVSDPTDADPQTSAATVSPSDPLVVTEADVEIGRQVWQSLLSDLARTIPVSDLDRLAGVIVLGQDASGNILLGAPSPLAQRLLAGRYRTHVEASLAALLSQTAPLHILSATDWTVGTSQ